VSLAKYRFVARAGRARVTECKVVANFLSRDQIGSIFWYREKMATRLNISTINEGFNMLTKKTYQIIGITGLATVAALGVPKTVFAGFFQSGPMITQITNAICTATFTDGNHNHIWDAVKTGGKCRLTIIGTGLSLVDRVLIGDKYNGSLIEARPTNLPTNQPTIPTAGDNQVQAIIDYQVPNTPLHVDILENRSVTIPKVFRFNLRNNLDLTVANATVDCTGSWWPPIEQRLVVLQSGYNNLDKDLASFVCQNEFIDTD